MVRKHNDLQSRLGQSHRRLALMSDEIEALNEDKRSLADEVRSLSERLMGSMGQQVIFTHLDVDSLLSHAITSLSVWPPRRLQKLTCGLSLFFTVTSLHYPGE